MTDRLRRLHGQFLQRYAAIAGPGQRHVTSAEEADARNQAYLAAYRATAGEPSICRRARFLEEFAESALIRLEPDDLLAGSQKFCVLGFPAAVGKELAELGCASNAGHLVYDYTALLRDGVAGLLTRLCVRRETARLESEQRNLDAFIRALLAFRHFIQRHAETAEKLAQSLSGDAATEWQTRAEDLHDLAILPPTRFRQALQLAWFMQIFLRAENPAAAISYGRLDQCLWPFLCRDLESGAITPAAACDWIGAFLLRCGEGDISRNLAVGGVDTRGRDATRPLSILMLDMMRELRVFQPSLSVRLHPASPPELLRAAGNLAAAGGGQPGYINDDAVIPGLLELGIPQDLALDYGMVGGYDAAPQGDGYPNTAGGALSLTEVLVRFLDTDTARQMPDFNGFLQGWYLALDRTYGAMLAQRAQPAWNHWRDQAPSPFGSVVMAGCIENARPLEACGSRFNLFGITILGLSAGVDSLHVIRELIYHRRGLTLPQLAATVTGNFPDAILREKLRHLPGRFSSDSETTRALTREVSATVARMVLNSRMDNGVRPYPYFARG